jgi:hypothetical protein
MVQDENNALRRETFLVCDKENNGFGVLPRTPAKANISKDSLDASPAAAMALSTSKWAKNILNQFTMSPLVTNNVYLINAQQPNVTFSLIDDGTDSPKYDSRRCSTSVKQVPLPGGNDKGDVTLNLFAINGDKMRSRGIFFNCCVNFFTKF